MSKPKAGGTGLQIDEGAYVLTIKTIADIGTQTQKKFGSDPDDEDESDEVDVRQLIVEAEMSEAELDGETIVTSKVKPLSIAMWLKNSTHEKSNLFALEKACGIKDPANTDLDNLLGKSFLGGVTHTKSGRPKVKTFTALPKGQKVGKTFMPLRSVYLDETFDAEAFEGMSDFVQKKILLSPEYDKVSAKKTKKKGGK